MLWYDVTNCQMQCNALWSVEGMFGLAWRYSGVTWSDKGIINQSYGKRLGDLWKTPI